MVPGDLILVRKSTETITGILLQIRSLEHLHENMKNTFDIRVLKTTGQITDIYLHPHESRDILA